MQIRIGILQAVKCLTCWFKHILFIVEKDWTQLRTQQDPSPDVFTLLRKCTSKQIYKFVLPFYLHLE